jgi:NDP-sugar pyrophosphorylase family protein
MKALILAGGFGTRMGHLAEVMPKAMIMVDGKTLLDHLLEKLNGKPIITVNRRFERFFKGYANVLIEEATSNEEKLGAISAIDNAIQKLGIDEDLFVLCSDNYFSSDFKEFLTCYTGEPLIGVYYIGDKPKLKPEELGTVSFEGSDYFPPPRKSFYINAFQEKSTRPLSKYVSVGAYIFPKSIFPILKEYCHGKKRDEPGKFIEYLINIGIKVKGYLFSGDWYDISQRSFVS